MNSVCVCVDDIVEDIEIVEIFKLWYWMFCKCFMFNDEFLLMFNLLNVEFIDVSEVKGVECIIESVVVVNGVEYEVDCIIYVIGFEIIFLL